MPLNLELKIKTPSHSLFEKKLLRINAEFKGILHQKDIYYHLKNGLLKLRVENGTYCLIKYQRDETGKRWSDYQLLFLNGENPEKYLSNLFNIEIIVEKRRKLFLYKDTRIHLDNVKGLGKYLELETLVIKGKTEAKQRFDEIISKLDIDISNQIRKSYKNMILESLKSK